QAVQSEPLRMRVIADFSPIADACGRLDYGQAEDYAVTIVLDSIYPLPTVELQGSAAEERALLSWVADGPGEVVGFEVERSRDGQGFEKIADIAGSVQRNYTYTDTMEEEGTYYYRIKSYNAQEESLSNVVELEWEKKEELPNSIGQPDLPSLVCYPNPVSGVLQIESGTHIRVIRLMNITGQV